MRFSSLTGLVSLLATASLALAQPQTEPGQASTVSDEPMGRASTVPEEPVGQASTLPAAGSPGVATTALPCLTAPAAAPPGVATTALPCLTAPAAAPLSAQPLPVTGDACASEAKSCPHGYAWFRQEFLVWWVHGQPAPPLVTTGSTAVPASQFGVLGLPTTSVLFGGQNLGYGATPGLRFRGGIEAPEDVFGLELGGFLLEQRNVGINLASDPNGNPLIVRPFIVDSSGVGGRTVTSAPGNFSGALAVNSTSRFWGAEANATGALINWSPGEGRLKLEVLGGIRFLELTETLTMNQNSTVLPGGNAAFTGNFLFTPAEVLVNDSFSTSNEFLGAQVGTHLDYEYHHFFVDALAKIGVGGTRQILAVNGASTAVVPGGPTMTAPGGVLALPSNIGHQAHDDISLVPELNVNLGYEPFDHVRLFVGYTLLYWSDVVRPGDQTDLRVSIGQIPTSPAFGQPSSPALPAPGLHRSDFWAQGVNCGLAFQY